MTRQIIFKHFYDLRPVAATAIGTAATVPLPVPRREAALSAGGKTIDKPNKVYK